MRKSRGRALARTRGGRNLLSTVLAISGKKSDKKSKKSQETAKPEVKIWTKMKGEGCTSYIEHHARCGFAASKKKKERFRKRGRRGRPRFSQLGVQNPPGRGLGFSSGRRGSVWVPRAQEGN